MVESLEYFYQKVLDSKLCNMPHKCEFEIKLAEMSKKNSNYVNKFECPVPNQIQAAGGFNCHKTELQVQSNFNT